jgi:error-prone DNA polymerase
MFVELHAQSAFSFLEAAEQPEGLVAEAARLDMGAIALVDRDGLYGAPRFYQAATRAGIRPLIGSELTLDDGARLPVLVEDREGYQNLSRLITLMKMRAPKGEGALALDEIAPYATGLVCLTGGAHGPLARLVTAGRHRAARAYLGELVQLFGASNCFVEIQRHFDRAGEQTLQSLVRMARDAGLPPVATNQPLYCESPHGREPTPGDDHFAAWSGGRALADVLTCIREKTTLDTAGRLLALNDERRLKPGLEMARLFADLPEAVTTTGELAMRLAFTLKDVGYRFPDYPLPPGQTAHEHLRALAEQGARKHYAGGPLEDKARRQIARELEIIGRLDLAGYFLIVWDIVEYCRSQEILVQGRGSAANSAVCYALGITAVDAVGMDLLFERFLSEARGEWPDIDLDLPSGDRREAVIQHVYRKYGRLGAAMTANVITYRGRSAAREVGKALGLPEELRERLSKLVPIWGYRDPADVLTRHLAAAGCDPTHPRIRAFAALWTRIQDLPRHLGQHSGGMVIAAGRLDDIVPLEPATMPGRVVVQWDKEDCAALGIIKVDLLGLRMMSVIQEAIEIVGETGGAVDLAHLPADDPTVYAMLRDADTIGVFQVESRAQMATLPRIQPERFYDLVVQVAIIRPGPIVGDMVHPYINRRRGREPVTYAHPSLEPILERTLGVPLFQEQLLRMAMATAGFTGTEAEELRRAFGFKRSEARMKEVEAKLRAGMTRQGIEGEAAEQIVHAITAFALYGFPECVVGATLIIDADTGRRVAIEDIVQGRVRVEATLACDAEMRLVRRRIVKATASGRRMVYRLGTALGREILATAEHPLLTLQGWRGLGSLRPGDRIATARTLALPSRVRWPRHQIIVVADLMAEGNLCHPSTMYFYTTDSRHCHEFVRCVERFDNTLATIRRHRNCYSVHVRRRNRERPAGAVAWIKQLGLWGLDSHRKYLPGEVFALHVRDIALLLARLWDGDGSLSLAGHASYDTVSRTLAEGIQHLLLRLGIVSRVYERTRRYRERNVISFVVTVTGRENLRQFAREVSVRFLDARKRRLAQVLAASREPERTRSSRDVVPVDAHHWIASARLQRSVTWREVGRAANVALREIATPSPTKGGYQRWVIARLARFLRSPELARLATSDLYWDRVTAIEPVGMQETYDLQIEYEHNFLANDLVVHNSHASSFALLAYASAYLKAHHAPAFYAALLNNQPMGFYHPATIVKDAQRHGQRILPVDVTRSDWLCTVELMRSDWRFTVEPSAPGMMPPRIAREARPGDSLAVRLGLRSVKGLRESAAKALVAARAERPFASPVDVAHRVPLDREERETLASIGAFASLAGTRRQNVWAMARTLAGPLFAAVEGDEGRGASREVDPGGAGYGGHAMHPRALDEPSPLREMTEIERLEADYGGTGVTIGRHPMALRRADLTRAGVIRAGDLASGRTGSPVRVAGSVIVRQRPGTAKGFVFLSLEDETGIANVIVTPQLFQRHRLALVTEPILLVAGVLQKQDGVVSVKAGRVQGLPPLAHNVPSHDFG